MATVCTGFIEPLNWECLLVNMFAGSMEVFFFLALFFVASVGAYFRMLNATLLIMFALFGIVMAQFSSGIYFLIILVGGLFATIAIKRIQTR